MDIQLMKMCKRKNVKLQSSYPEEDVIQTYKEMTVFFFSSFTINTFNSLAERQAKFKIVSHLKIVSYSLLVINKNS